MLRKGETGAPTASAGGQETRRTPALAGTVGSCIRGHVARGHILPSLLLPLGSFIKTEVRSTHSVTRAAPLS